MKKTNKFLIIGYGSIGRRHLKNILSFNKNSSLAVFTKQKIEGVINFSNLKEIKKYNPDYIIICTPTSDHFKKVKLIEKKLKKKKVLDEKPLF